MSKKHFLGILLLISPLLVFVLPSILFTIMFHFSYEFGITEFDAIAQILLIAGYIVNTIFYVLITNKDNKYNIEDVSYSTIILFVLGLECIVSALPYAILVAIVLAIFYFVLNVIGK